MEKENSKGGSLLALKKIKFECFAVYIKTILTSMIVSLSHGNREVKAQANGGFWDGNGCITRINERFGMTMDVNHWIIKG